MLGSQLSGGGLLPKTLESFLSVSSGKNFLSQWESQRTKPTTKRKEPTLYVVVVRHCAAVLSLWPIRPLRRPALRRNGRTGVAHWS